PNILGTNFLWVWMSYYGNIYIFLYCGEDGKLKHQSGALEYECDDYNVLQLVADNIDGGLDSSQKRWKRYEKNNRI
ncbi:MAG: hypothetical protein II028_02190, partial [Clostridia bacterium]|nr:hypothetical protein [Clostridia bacterium]